MAGKRFDPIASHPARVLALALPLGATLALLAASGARAGSIFMKNGYIIQGPIVEHSEGTDGSVILGWPQGKVTIYKRFIEKIDFEAGEEKNVKLPDGQVRPAEEPAVTGATEEELPQSLTELVKIYKLPPALVEGRAVVGPEKTDTPPVSEAVTVQAPPAGAEGAGATASANPQEGAPAPAGESGATKAPEPGTLSERSVDPRWGFSIQPPSGWKQAEVEGCVSWTGSPGPDGFAPSMNVASVPARTLTWEEACRALREDQATGLEKYEFAGDESFEIGNRPAYRVGGRGLPRGTSPAGEKRVTVRQVIVGNGGKIWLLSTFARTDAPDALADVLDRSVRTLLIQG